MQIVVQRGYATGEAVTLVLVGVQHMFFKHA